MAEVMRRWMPGEIMAVRLRARKMYGWQFIGPDTPPKGELLDSEPMTSSQVAATIAAFLGFEYRNEKPCWAGDE